MSKEKLIKLLPAAIEAAKTLVENDSIDKTYNGYISSMGASIISAGLLPTVMFYANQGEGKDRTKLLDAVALIMKIEATEDLTVRQVFLEQVLDSLQDKTLRRRLEAEIQLAVTALKLAIRTFPESTN